MSSRISTWLINDDDLTVRFLFLAERIVCLLCFCALPLPTTQFSPLRTREAELSYVFTFILSRLFSSSRVWFRSSRSELILSSLETIFCWFSLPEPRSRLKLLPEKMSVNVWDILTQDCDLPSVVHGPSCDPQDWGWIYFSSWTRSYWRMACQWCAASGGGVFSVLPALHVGLVQRRLAINT